LIEANSYKLLDDDEEEAAGEETMMELAEDWSCQHCDGCGKDADCGEGERCSTGQCQRKIQQGEEGGGARDPEDDDNEPGRCSSHKECGPDSRCFLQQGRCVNMDTSDLLGMLLQLQREEKQKNNHQPSPSGPTVLW
jgi:hypothetical protein